MRYVTGRLDMVARVSGPAPGLYHVQFKTLSQYESTDAYVRAISMSLHESTYSWLWNETEEEKLKGTLLVVFRKTVPGKWDAKTKSRTYDPAWNPFERHRITIVERDRARAVESIECTWDVLDACKDAETWPCHPRACVRYGRTCELYDTCKIGLFDKDKFTTREEDYVDTSPYGKDAVMNVSRIETFQTCPRLYEHRYIKNLVRKGDEEERTALAFGTAVHKAMEMYYEPDSHGRPALDLARAIAAFKKSLPEGHDERAKEVETSGYGEYMLTKYAEKFADIDAATFEEIVGNEVSITAEMP